MGRLLITILLLGVGLTPATAETVKVVGVYTGDTFAVERQGEEVKVRLYGVDAPVAGQHGNVSSKRFLKRLIQGLTLQMNVVGRDVFDTPLAIAVREGKESSVNAAIVSQGYAWVNPQTCSLEPCEQWKRLESQARKLKLGIWSGFDLVPPWEFRQAQTR